MTINKFWIRIMGLSGILGGIILFVGDMLFYYDSINTNFEQNMGNASDFRIIASGVSALFATWLYMIGLGQVHYAFKPVNPILRNSVLISFGGILTAYGIIHAAYVAIATTAKLSIKYNIDMMNATSLASETNQILRLFVFPVFAILSFLFISQVWKRKTLYPRWILLFFPLVPFLVQDLICQFLSGSVWIVVCGGYLNLILIVFFTASTISLWNIKKAHN